MPSHHARHDPVRCCLTPRHCMMPTGTAGGRPCRRAAGHCRELPERRTHRGLPDGSVFSGCTARSAPSTDSREAGMTDARSALSAPRRSSWPLGSWPVERIRLSAAAAEGSPAWPARSAERWGITPCTGTACTTNRELKAAGQREQIRGTQRDWCRAPGGPGWIIDGNYACQPAIRLEAADTVIFRTPRLGLPMGLLQRRSARRRAARRDRRLRPDHWNFIATSPDTENRWPRASVSSSPAHAGDILVSRAAQPPRRRRGIPRGVAARSAAAPGGGCR